MNRRLSHFSPYFDDAIWTNNWSIAGMVHFPEITHPSNYRIDEIILNSAEVFSSAFRLTCPLRCNRLIDPQGIVWMSNTPQERMMMYNYARESQGHILVGGLGLATYIQYAQMSHIGQAERFTIIEKDEIVVEMVLPIIEKEITVPFEVIVDSVESFLLYRNEDRYNTIFIDIWDRLDAVQLPKINTIRNLALKHVAEKGNILLWGYRWMLRLFEDACRYILKMPPESRKNWLMGQKGTDPEVISLLAPVVSHYERYSFEDMDRTLRWCMDYIVNVADAQDRVECDDRIIKASELQYGIPVSLRTRHQS